MTAVATTAAGGPLDAASALEQRLATHRELEALQLARECAAAELERLQELGVLERRRLEHCRQQRGRLEEKLRRCSEVVAQTVSSMDRLHSISDEEIMEQGTTIRIAQADVVAAGVAAAQALSSITEGDSQDEAEEEKQNECKAVPSEFEVENKENALPPRAGGKEGSELGDDVKVSRRLLQASTSEAGPAEELEQAVRTPLRQIEVR